MKNEFFYENIDRLYAAAKEKHGDKAEEALVEAVRKTAGKFKKLGEKAYITLLLQELGASAFYEGAEPAPEGLAASMESAFAEGLANAKKKNRLFAILGGAAAVCLAVVIGSAIRGSGPSSATTIEGAKEYKSGDFVLANVHTINDYISFDGDFELIVSSNNKELTASTVAPDGTVYLLTVCATDTEAEIDTLGLFRMVGDGWDEVCRFEQKFSYIENPLNKDRFKISSRNFVFCDTESRPFVFLYDAERQELMAYSCDWQTKKSEHVSSISVQIQMTDNAYSNIVACVDGEYVYFAADKFITFSFESQDFRTGNDFPASGLLMNAIVHRGNRTYLLGRGLGRGATLALYAITDITQESQALIYEKQFFMGYFQNRADGASLLVDAAGTAYVFGSFRETDSGRSTIRHALEIISAEGENLTSMQYSPLRNPEDAVNCGIFMSNDETLYFVETYARYGIYPQLTIGAIAGTDYSEIREVACFDGAVPFYIWKPQFISDLAGETGVFLDLIGVSNNSTTVLKYGYMRLLFN